MNITRSVFLAQILTGVIALADGCFHDFRIYAPEPELGPIQLNQPISQAKIAIVSHSTLDVDYVSLAKVNHLNYAEKHGYDYIFRNGNIDDGRFRDFKAPDKLHQLGLYWQKIAAVQAALRNKNYEWVMWIDADAIFTNVNIRVEDLLEKYPERDLIIGPDEFYVFHDKINSGVFLVRNTPWSVDFFKTIARLYPRYKDNRTPEQQAMQDHIYGYVCQNAGGSLQIADVENRSYGPENIATQVAIIPQREINAFYTPPGKGPESGRWQPGDYIAHFAGVKGRLAQMSALLDCIASKGYQHCPWPNS